MYDEVELKDREIIEILPHTNGNHRGSSLRSFGVALDNDEAQVFLEKDWCVFCDEEGPYLVVRAPSGQPLPSPSRADVTFHPIPWVLNNDWRGVICWMKDVS